MSVADNNTVPSGFLAGIGRYHWLVFIGCWMGGIFDGMDSTMMAVVLPVSIADLIHTTDKAQVSQIGAYVMSIFLLGWTLGGILFGVIGDKLGRVKSMILSILLYAIFTGLGGLAWSWQSLAVCRFLTGLGIGGELVSISTFLTEVWPERSRAVAIGVLITSYQAGVFIAGTVHNIFPDWRMTFFIGALPALMVIFLRMALKESDKWMAAKQKQLHLTEDVSQFQRLFKKAHAKNLFIGGLAFGGLLIGYWASLSWIPAWIQELLGPNAEGHERAIATMYQGVAAILGCSLAGILSDTIGRRATIALSYTGCTLASALLFLTNTVFSPVIYWESALLGFFIGMAQAIMYIYLPELFPTLVRASGTGFCLNVGRFITAISVLLVGTLVVVFGGYAMAALVFSMSYLLGVLAAALGKETKGQTLPE